MRFSNIVVIATCAISIAALAGTKTEETKPKSEDTKIEMNKPNTKLTALSAEGNTSNRQNSSTSQQNVSTIGSVKATDNVQGLAPTDRHYRYND